MLRRASVGIAPKLSETPQKRIGAWQSSGLRAKHCLAYRIAVGYNTSSYVDALPSLLGRSRVTDRRNERGGDDEGSYVFYTFGFRFRNRNLPVNSPHAAQNPDCVNFPNSHGFTQYCVRCTSPSKHQLL